MSLTQWLGFLSASLLVACASQVPNDIRQAPSETPSEAVIRQNIQSYVGNRVRWGGTVVSITNRQAESVIEIISRPLESGGRPQEDQLGLGRFLARYPGFLDPALITAGQPVTVLGVIEGEEQRLIGEYRYQFPVVKIENYYLWPPLPVPSYSPYWYDPWWYDPWWPYPRHPYRYW